MTKTSARALAVGGLAAAALIGSAGAALADDCANVSRAPAPCGMNCTTGPVIEGNWVWLPSIGVPEPAWGFAPPGGPDSVAFGLPGSNGNYTNGQVADLLGVAATHSTQVCLTPSRTTQPHGIQSGACGG